MRKSNSYTTAAAILVTLVLLFYNPPLVALAAGVVFWLVAHGVRYIVTRFGPDD